MNTLFLIMLLVFIAAGILAVLIIGALNNFAERENNLENKD
jgi:hypothetical protein